MAIHKQNPLVLRSFGRIAAGFVLGPTAGLTAYWALWIAPRNPWPLALVFWWFTVLLGGTACLMLELAVVAPLLAGYRRHRWTWLNGWTAVAIGFSLGAICSLAWAVLEAMLPQPAGSVAVAGKEIAIIVDGVRTAEGWRYWRGRLAPDAAATGMVGAVAALVFRLVAVRTERPGAIPDDGRAVAVPRPDA